MSNLFDSVYAGFLKNINTSERVNSPELIDDCILLNVLNECLKREVIRMANGLPL